MDDKVDILEWKGELLVFNHISLERIFGYRDVFVEKTKEAMIQLQNKDIMENMEQFENDCLRDSRIQKRFTNMIMKERLPLFFEHIDKAPEVVEKLGLDLQFNESGQLIYERKEQLFTITSLMNDAYFESLLAKRVGVVELEGSIGD